MKVINISMLFKFTCTFLFFSFGVLVSNTSAQEIISLPIEWGEPVQLLQEEKSATVPSINGQELDNGKPVFFWRKKLKSTAYRLELVDYTTSPAPAVDIAHLASLSIGVPNEIPVELKVTRAGNESYAVVYVLPYVIRNNVVHRVTQLVVNLVPTVVPVVDTPKDFAVNSVLMEGSGRWYKIGVTKDGIYKIDRSFLESCGISTVGLNPKHVHIYGNGDGKLPEVNMLPRTDDLAKNALFVVGEQDNLFNDGDYILFYGWGPNRWKANSAVDYDQLKNPYSDVSYYFININPNEVPLRIETLPSSGASVTTVVESYTYADVYENDLVNLVKGGQRWYGELFDAELERVFNFSVPNIDPLFSATFKTAIATNCRNSAGTAQRYSVNNTVLFDSNLPTVADDFVRSSNFMSLPNPPVSMPFKISIFRSNPSTLVYLDRIVLNARRKLVFFGQQMNFRDLNSVSLGNVSQFELTNFPSSGFVWDVTNRHVPKLITGELAGSVFRFIQSTDSLREFVAAGGSQFFTPEKVGDIANQNLHALPQADYLIVTHKDFSQQANRLANLHRTNGTTVHVVNTEEIFNEFSSGMLDPTAIRMFAKMFYDRAALAPSTRPKYMLLFGDGTYDPKNRIEDNNNFVPTYQVEDGENHISALVTDDYYGMLDDAEGISATDLLDIGIGRLLISDNQTAKQQVDKIEHYMKNGSTLFSSSGSDCAVNENGKRSTFGDWRLNYVQITDDEEGGYFIKFDAEPQYNHVTQNFPEMNCDKLYTDAYPQVITGGGPRYPEVFDAITNRIERGTLVINYIGHGGESGFAEERIVTIPQIQSWKNIDKLNLFVSATCEFSRYDDPSRLSAGEIVSLNPIGGAIALMTTTRSVYFSVNTLTGKRFFENVFVRDTDNQPRTFGEIIRLTKNASGASDNKRSFTLIGDPALRLALPLINIQTDSINGLDPSVQTDTINALSKVTIKGHVANYDGSVNTSFNGILSPTIFDKVKTQYTLGQDINSPILPFETQRNIVYKGKVSVKDGYFSFTFIVPKDINFAYGPGKISYYADNSEIDASGEDKRFTIGGINPNGINDLVGPEIDLFLNEESFVSGGITNETPVLIAKLFDENGINTVGNGIGHDLTAIIDEKTAKPIVLNDYYTADLDSYQSGTIRYSLPKLEQGRHTLSLKVWDVNNNSSTQTIDFVVQERSEVALAHVLNYPNPFTTRTEFLFEHNQVCADLETQIQIYTVAGRLVKTINQTVQTEGFRVEGIAWDGRDDFGDQLAKGVYVYTLKVRTPTGEIAEKTEKLVLLK
jgi:hypothetical protein